jgi:hypothetical protein
VAQNKITGYHGTSAAAADCIRREQHFRESTNDDEWLGSGVYFFFYRRHAENWIIRRKLKQGTVLTVQLQYDDDAMLDLDDPNQMQSLNHEMESLNKLINDSISVQWPEKDALHKRWCFGCNLYRQLHPEIGIISYTFPQKKTGVSNFHFNERQLCVSQSEIIADIA